MGEKEKKQQPNVPAKRESSHQSGELQINIPPVDSTELSAISQGITERTNHAIDKAVAPSSKAAQNVLDAVTFQKMVDNVLNSDLPPKDKVEMCKELVRMKDESDRMHADLENENIRVQTAAITSIQRSQGPTWDQIGYAMRVAGRIGLKALEFWINMKMFW